MKRLIAVLVCACFFTASFAQLTLTYSDYAPKAGDMVTSDEIQYVAPGPAGPDRIWDFSKIQYTGKSLACSLNPGTKSENKEAGIFNIVSVEDGHTYFNNVSQDRYEVNGYNTDNITLVYSDPLLKIKYPFAYGDRFIDPFAGSAVANSVSNISFDGENIVTADGYGTLVLPDRMLKNTLRVRTEKNAIEIRPCTVLEAHIVGYQWYAPGYRYPVLTLLSKEYTYNGEDPQPAILNAYVCLQQSSMNSTAASVQEQQIAGEDNDFAVVTYPNPFSDDLTYSYYIRQQMPVSIGLYDVSGKLLIDMVNTQEQADGVHSGSIDAGAGHLTPGVYYIRFSFDKKTVVSKVVKI